MIFNVPLYNTVLRKLLVVDLNVGIHSVLVTQEQIFMKNAERQKYKSL